MENVAAVPGKKWAVIQTGSISDGGDFVPFKDAAGKKLPVVLYSHDDESRVRKMKGRVTRNATAITAFNDDTMATSAPVLGVVQISTVPKVKRAEKPATATIPATVPATQTAHAKPTGAPKK